MLNIKEPISRLSWFNIISLNTDLSKNNLGSHVALSSAAYTFPSDGYVCMYANASTSAKISVYIMGSDDNTANAFYVSTAYANGSNGFNSVFVRKGMKAKIDVNSGGSAFFIPFE